MESQKRSNITNQTLENLFHRSFTITIIIRATILEIVISQKSIDSLNDLYLDGCLLKSSIAVTLYLIPSLILENRSG